MNRKKILWLCSWYPSSAEPFNGDFIQRHAKAASLFNDIHVIHVGGSEIMNAAVENNFKQEGGLTEKIILYKSKKGLVGKFFNHLRWKRLFLRTVKKCIDKKGKPDLVHVHVPMKAGLIALWIKRKYSIPYVLTEHWGIYNEILRDNFSNKPSWIRNIIAKTFFNAVVCTSVSKYLQGNISRYILPDLKFRIINNVVNTELFYLKEKQKGKFRFIHVSNMIPLKNAEGILKTFAELKRTGIDAELIMVGDQDETLHQFADQLGLLNQSVFFRGEIAYEQVAEEMQQADCLILFSNIENSPCVIGEALCCGLPVIATNVGGIPELVNDLNGRLVEPNDTNSLLKAMLEMISNYSQFNKKQIAEDAHGKFSYPVIGKQFDELYRSIS